MCLCVRKMNSEDRQVYSVCILQFYCFTKYNRLQSKHKQTKCEHSRRNSYLQITAFLVGITILNLKRRYRIRHHEFPCLLGHPVPKG